MHVFIYYNETRLSASSTTASGDTTGSQVSLKHTFVNPPCNIQFYLLCYLHNFNAPKKL